MSMLQFPDMRWVKLVNPSSWLHTRVDTLRSRRLYPFLKVFLVSAWACVGLAQLWAVAKRARKEAPDAAGRKRRTPDPAQITPDLRSKRLGNALPHTYS